MRVCALGLWLALLAWPALAEAPKLAVAPAGECAGEERDLAPRVLPKREAPGELPGPLAPATGANALTHLTPTQVAAAAPAASVPLPSPPAFAGPGACDTPGSGCAPAKVVDDPDPGTGCGFPGSPCP